MTVCHIVGELTIDELTVDDLTLDELTWYPLNHLGKGSKNGPLKGACSFVIKSYGNEAVSDVNTPLDGCT